MSLLTESFTNLIDINSGDSSNSNNSNNIKDTFFIIYRNKYLLKCIQKKIYTNFKFQISNIGDLNEIQKQYLSTCSNIKDEKDTFDIRLVITTIKQFKQYLNSQYKHIISEVLVLYPSSIGENVLNLSVLPQGLSKLTTYCFGDSSSTKIKGKPPTSVNDITLMGSKSTNLDEFISNLPSNLTRLYFPSNYSIEKECVLPTTLRNLFYRTTGCQSLKNLVVPPNKTYKSCHVKINQIDDFDWVKSQPWIVNVASNLNYAATMPNIFSCHLKELTLKSINRETSKSLPQTLEYLTLKRVGKDGIVVPSRLKYLCVRNWVPKLEIGDLPPTLGNFNVTVYRKPLDAGVLPSNLKTLYMKFNKRLQLGVLPNSLTNLYLGVYNKPLDPFVLPPQLKILNLPSFNQPLGKDSLPNSITEFNLQIFDSSMDGVGPLDNLQKLLIQSLHSSMLNVLSNVKNLTLTLNSISPDNSLQNTSIIHLNLIYHNYLAPPKEIHVGMLPSTLKNLSLVNMVVKSPGVIPNGVIYLTCKDIESNVIPPSIRYINRKSINNYYFKSK